MGTATASNNYFRQIGGSLGSAIVASLSVARLTERLPAGSASGGAGSNSLTPEVIKTLPPEVRKVIVGAYNDALTPVSLHMVPLALPAAGVLIFVHEKPLATTTQRDVVPERTAGRP